MSRAGYLSMLWCCLAMLFGCGDSTHEGVADAGSADADASMVVPADDVGINPDTTVPEDTGMSPDTGDSASLAWGVCAEGYRGSCAEVAMPLDWDAPQDHAPLNIHLSRRLGTEDGSRALWLLQGGPGGSVRGLAGLVDILEMFAPEYTVYTVEHRGVGASGHLSCPEQEADRSPGGPQITIDEWPDCLAWTQQTYGDQLPWMTTTQAARDLLHAVAVTRRPGEQVLLMGISYGTYWAHRALQLDGEAFDGVILDSIIPPGADYAEFERNANDVGGAFLEACLPDTSCAARLGDDPWQFLSDLYDRMRQLHCFGSGLNVATLKTIVSAVLMGDQGLRSFIAPLLYRLDRCNSDDREAIGVFIQNLFPENTSGNTDDFSLVLQNHIVLSELWGEPPLEFEALNAVVAQNLFAFGAAPNIAVSYDTWPRYTRPELADAVAETDAPLLMLVGDLDPRSPPRWGDRLGTQLTGEHQSYVVVRGGTHGVMFQSAVRTFGQLPCGLQLVLDFMDEPTMELDVSCLNNLRPIDFAPSPALSLQFMGTEDPWGDP